MRDVQTNSFVDAIQAIKSAILKSRYRAAVLANRELLSLYYGIGKYISENSRKGFWGTGAIETISEKLQQELPGLRGFSTSNMKNMRMFYEEWWEYFENRTLTTDDLELTDNQSIKKRALITHEIPLTLLMEIRPLAADVNRQTTSDDLQCIKYEDVTNRQMPSDDLLFITNLKYFFSIGFSHHIAIINKVKSREERLFYIQKCATEFWSYETLKYHLKSHLYEHRGKMQNNFQATISDNDLQRKALQSFKDELLLDYINIEAPDDEPDERVLESEIVGNIRKFIMSLGKDFSFIGNQYRLVVEEQEYFIDLLFFNRQLQSLVAFELKRGDFKPEYLGKMNFYLSALDDLVRLPHENPSIGVILCKSKKQKVVEYAFRDMSKPMGVTTYKTATELPPEYRDALPDVERLKELL